MMTLANFISGYGIFITLLGASIGYFFKGFKERKLRQRNDSLNLVNKRLEEFYGPLYFIVEAGEKSFRALQEHLGKTSFRPDNLTESEYKEWRTWYINVFHPQNLQKERIIIEKSYLIDGDEIPPCLVDFISHISFYKAIIERWKNNDFSVSSPLIGHPDSMKGFIQDGFLKLKKEQEELINM
jgi:hypothetical protein